MPSSATLVSKKGAHYWEDIQCCQDKVLQLHPTPPNDASHPPSIKLLTEYAALTFMETVLDQYPTITLNHYQQYKPLLTLAGTVTSQLIIFYAKENSKIPLVMSTKAKIK